MTTSLPILTLLTLALAIPHGTERRPASRPFLNLPASPGGVPPARLSLTGAFGDVRSLSPSAGLIPYDLIVPFWSDGASKRRWVSIPSGRTIAIAPDGSWRFPAGTVFVKHFEIATDTKRPAVTRRLETRLLVVDDGGGVRGFSYRWRPDSNDADLVTQARVEPIAMTTDPGTRPHDWPFPGPNDCRACHTAASGGVLGVRAEQLNRDFADPSGAAENQLRAWNRLGLFDHPIPDEEIDRLPRLARSDDRRRTIEDRARSYLDANCAHCHRPGGVPADFDARFSTPRAEQRLIGQPARIDLGIDAARMISPNDPWRSAILTRLLTTEPTKMPPLAHSVVDRQGGELLRAWIAELPGPPVLPPPTIRPRGGDLRGPVRVAIDHPDREATVRFTLDGSPPGKSSPIYSTPLVIGASTTIRARAYRSGWTRSITVQETFILGD